MSPGELCNRVWFGGYADGFVMLKRSLEGNGALEEKLKLYIATGFSFLSSNSWHGLLK